MLRYLTAGESHGRALVVIVEGMPAGLLVTAEDIQRGLTRRRLGFGRGPRMRFEVDEVTLVGGIRHGRTLGSPVAIEIANTEWPKWETEMSASPGLPSKVLTQPRPGHADLSGMLKYGLNDARDVLERASARETAARVAAGTLAKLLLWQIGIDVISHIVQLGPERAAARSRPTVADLVRIDESQVRCADPGAEARMIAAVKAAAKAGDSLGGVAEVIAYGVPVGLGSHVQWDRRLDALLAQALMSIQAVKAVEFGDGWEVAGLRGSEAHDAIRIPRDDNEETAALLGGGYLRDTHRAGGIEGGISTGSPIVSRVAMKPLASL
ncbi:MAG TPA: chorismate synthase, partial [Acidimicrobiales bacterium]|nr:chorismate synthase [Acidimicrobiales bacterium]